MNMWRLKRKIKIVKKAFLILLFLTTTILAEPLTKNDIENLKRKIKEHILYETYLETDKGLASVFISI